MVCFVFTVIKSLILVIDETLAFFTAANAYSHTDVC